MTKPLARLPAPPSSEPRPDGAVPGTRADWVDRRLRNAILSGELKPGEKLVAGPLAQRFAVSATPLREAIQRLAMRGLVEIEPQRGARVAAASPRDAEEIYELRALLDPRALRDSLTHSDDAHRAAIDAAYERMVQPGEEVDFVTVADRHAAFHAALLKRCRSRWLRRITDLLADHSQRYALLAPLAGVDGGHHDAVAEHRALRDAALAGDVTGATALLREHLEQTLVGLRALAAPPKTLGVTGARGHPRSGGSTHARARGHRRRT